MRSTTPLHRPFFPLTGLRNRRTHSTPPPSRRLTALAVTLVVAACGGSSTEPPIEPPDPPPTDTVWAVPASGSDATFDVVTWNIRQFGAGSRDPGPQIRRVRDVVSGVDADLWGVQEISDSSDFATVMTELAPRGYARLLANDPSVEGGGEHYPGNSIKVGIVYKTAAVSVSSARIILEELDYEFAGRPPMEILVEVTHGGATMDAVVVVLHAKASADSASWARRQRAGDGLKEYLDATWGATPVWVIGDWNDDVDVSITEGLDTPYRTFVDAAPDWVFPTEFLSRNGISSIPRYEDPVDHILASDEVMAGFQDGSVQVLRVDSHIPDFENAASDHLPVFASFRLGG